MVGTSVPPTVEVASHLLALMGYSPGIETLAVVLKDPLRRVLSFSVMLLALGSSTCSGGAVAFPSYLDVGNRATFDVNAVT